MGQEMAHQKPRLAGLRELGPVVRDRRLEVEQARVDQTQRAHGANRLADRIQVDDRVAPPRPGPRAVGEAAPEVDDGRTVDVDRERRADFDPRGERVGERLAYAPEGSLTVTLDDRGALAHVPPTIGGASCAAPSPSARRRAP